jgi:hypothetical protein
VLATTVAAALTEDFAQRSDPKRRGRHVRADVYERVITGMGLGEHFQVVRRYLEYDHTDYVHVETAWPRSSDPVRPIAFLRTEGPKDPYLVYHGPRVSRR